jgi:hypothetical protein
MARGMPDLGRTSTLWGSYCNVGFGASRSLQDARAKVGSPPPNRTVVAAAGDVVTVTRIDRLARSNFDLFGIIKRIVGAKA